MPKASSIYRTDALKRDSDTFTWSTDVLRGLELGREEVGVSARTDDPASAQAVYLVIRRAGRGVAPVGLRAVMLPDAELEEVYISLLKGDSYLLSDEPLL